MSLREWQATLLKILPAPEQAAQILTQNPGQLSRRELEQLSRLSQSTGLEVTRDVQIWWRQARLQIAVPFSMRLIQRLGLQHLLSKYQKRPCTTLFFLREAQAFSDFIQQNPLAPAILRDLLRFECALHLARLRHTGAAPRDPSALSPDADTLELSMSYCPESCMAALLQNTPLPDSIPGGATIQINSDWPGLWCQRKPATSH